MTYTCEALQQSRYDRLQCNDKILHSIRIGVKEDEIIRWLPVKQLKSCIVQKLDRNIGDVYHLTVFIYDLKDAILHFELSNALNLSHAPYFDHLWIKVTIALSTKFENYNRPHLLAASLCRLVLMPVVQKFFFFGFAKVHYAYKDHRKISGTKETYKVVDDGNDMILSQYWKCD